MVVHTRTHTTKINVYYILLLQVQNNDGKRKEGIQCSYSMNFFLWVFYIQHSFAPKQRHNAAKLQRERKKR